MNPDSVNLSPASGVAADKGKGELQSPRKTVIRTLTARFLGQHMVIPPYSPHLSIGAKKTKACQVDRLHPAGLIILDRLCFAAWPGFPWRAYPFF
jgi:hypothetical protein